MDLASTYVRAKVSQVTKLVLSQKERTYKLVGAAINFDEESWLAEWDWLSMELAEWNWLSGTG